MSVYVLFNDLHLSDRAPNNCTDSYNDDLFDLLEQVAGIAAERDAAAIILAGDVFHIKTPSRTSHATVLRLIEWARYALVPVWAVPGNHDLLHDRFDSLAGQPLGVCFASDAIQLLDGWIPDDNNQAVYGVPWLMSFDDVTVSQALKEYRDRITRAGSPPHTLVVAHAPLYPPGHELPYEFYPVANWAGSMNHTGTVHYGHVHEPHGIYTYNDVTFSNPGALSRGSLTEANLTRVPTIALWDSETGRTEHLPLKAKPADQVFLLAKANAVKKHNLDLSTFLKSVAATQLDITSTDTVINHVAEEHPDDKPLIEVVRRLLEQVA